MAKGRAADGKLPVDSGKQGRLFFLIPCNHADVTTPRSKGADIPRVDICPEPLPQALTGRLAQGHSGRTGDWGESPGSGPCPGAIGSES
jgi:hypothetical protein